MPVQSCAIVPRAAQDGLALASSLRIVPKADLMNGFDEPGWRRPDALACGLAAQPSIVASRWTDSSTSVRREQACAPSDRYVVSIALRPTRLRFTRGPLTLTDGPVPVGMVHVTAPCQALEAEFHAPCDFIHLYVSAAYLENQQTALGTEPRRHLGDFMMRDPFAADLARTLIDGHNAANRLYTESIGQAIVMRMLTFRPSQASVNALPKWRLRRVHDYIVANIAEPILLNDLASVAGLSRMHFAAQFRAATNCSPHEYLLQQRIERAKAALSRADMPLVEVALSVGFQTQSHFSTVFKRLTGETPGQWRRGNQTLHGATAFVEGGRELEQPRARRRVMVHGSIDQRFA